MLVLAGADSDFLTLDTVARMQRSGPRVSSIEFPGCGHVPSLMRADQLDAVTAFLVADA